jgi:hypothetical protein
MNPKFLLETTIALLALCSINGLLHAAEPAITQDELVRRTQELFDAVAAGDKMPWQKYYAEDCIFHDEKGRGLDKTKLIADIEPLPAGYSGTIKVKNPESRITADVAVLSYDTEETETIFGQELHARYHGTDTWLRRDGRWQIVAALTMRYYEDPAIGQAEVEKFSGFVGAYALGPERKTIITTEKGELFMERTKGNRVQLFPESSDIFFRKGVEGRILFHADGQGRIDRLIDRRNNEDVVWKKVANK